ncbi:FMN-dependent NADH-azoreductase [Metabacillus bambusae]|uniref:FMN dependent NADH:quinone oxidoreductase n=1 Tax=Metabacillus bambusae TaxID=2795218 RepID=A0ABS3N0H6_9BACI|nr:FMN-dependent NADH-azoreductase [Metabacillus bambusae]MBO1511654.1 FMN-dependent NADH-azoreductase [Metabacillus bambusae]
MSNVLFIKANSRPISQAVSVQLYDAFLQSYKESHPEDSITELDLFSENLPYYGVDSINGMFKLGKGIELSSDEQAATATVKKYLDQFLSADKIVLAFPLWNFAVPAVLHTYMDYLCQAGTTFKYTPEGPVGLLSDKKVTLLNARGGVYSEGPAASKEMAVNYVTTILDFFGINNVTNIIIEGHNQFPEQASEIIENGLREAVTAANTF